MKKRLTINKVIIVVIFAVFIFSLVRQGIALKRIKESLSVERQNLNQLKEENEKLQAEVNQRWWASYRKFRALRIVLFNIKEVIILITYINKI